MILTVEPFPGDYREKQSLRETEERARSLSTASWDGPNPEKFNENIFKAASRLSTTTRENVVAVNSIGLRLLVHILQPAAIVLSESIETHSKFAIIIAGIPVLGIALLSFALLMLASIAIIAVATASTVFGVASSILCVFLGVILRLFLSVLPMIPLSRIFRATLEAIDSVLIGWKSEERLQVSSLSDLPSAVTTEETPERHIDLSNSNTQQPTPSLFSNPSFMCWSPITQRIQPALECIQREVNDAAIPVITVFASMTSIIFEIIVVYFPKCRDVVYKEATRSFVREVASPEPVYSSGEGGVIPHERRFSGSAMGPLPSQGMQEEEQIRLRIRNLAISEVHARAQSDDLRQIRTKTDPISSDI